MTKSEPRPREKGDGIVTDQIEEEYVIDTDFHLEVSPEALLEYIDDDRIVDKVNRFGTPPEARNVGGVSLQYSNNDPASNTHHGEALVADEISEVMENYGLDEAIITPTNHLPFGLTNYPKLSTELCRAYNDYLLDKIIDDAEGIHANLVVPYWEPEVAAKEIDRMGGEKNIVGAHGFINQQLWSDYDHDPIFEKLVEHNLPLAPHIGSLSAGEMIDSQYRTWMDHMVAGAGSHLIHNVVTMITSGVFDRFPDLRTVWVELGTQWIPYIANRMDDIYQLHPKDLKLAPRMYEDEQEYLDKMPSEYIYENMFTSTQPIALPDRSDEVMAVLKACHADQTFVFSTDWPHYSTDATNWLFETPGIDQELRSKIFHENAKEAYRIPA